MKPLHECGVRDLGDALNAREVSSVEVTEHLLARIESHASLGALLHRDAEVSLAQAKAADARRAQGEVGALLGIPLAHKDIFVTRDMPSTAGSKMLQGYASPFDATVVARLADAGVVMLGKLNCDEFAMGSSNQNSAYRPVKNPWDITRVPGGSSGGSAAAVAARLMPAATGSDTRRFDPPAGELHRRDWNQADLWRVFSLRHGGVCVKPGPGRPAGAKRRGLCTVARRDEWI